MTFHTISKRLIDRLETLLSENPNKCPLTDLYLTHPVLRSKDCTEQFRQRVLNFIREQSETRIRALINSAVSTASTYILAGGSENAPWILPTIGWLKRQRLKDGGWHWRPKRKLPTGAESEAWITAAVFSLLRRTGKADSKYLNTILSFLENNWNTKQWGGFPEVTLYYLGEGGIRESSPLIEKAIEWLKQSQLPNGAWAGYSEKTKQGGIFRTCVVLNALTAAGLRQSDKTITNGLKFAEARLDRILNARWGGTPVQALYSLASVYQNLGIT